MKNSLNTYSISNLVNLCINNNSNAQTLFYNKLYPILIKIPQKYNKNINYEISQDIVQDSFIVIFNNLHNINNIIKLDNVIISWCISIVKNKTIDYLRKLKMNYIFIDELYDNEQSNINNSLKKIYEKQCIDDYLYDKTTYLEAKNVTYNQIIDAVEELTPKYKTILKYYLFNGLTHSEIATILNIKKGTSKSSFFKAKNIIKNKLLKI